MEKVTIKDVVKNNKIARFSHAIAGNLYYKVEMEDGTTVQFKVDMNDKDDVGTTTFNAEEKALMMMRYIRKSEASGDLVVFK
jgi:hypothetical protein